MATDRRGRLAWSDLGIRESDLRQAEGMARILDRARSTGRRSLVPTLLPVAAAILLSGLLTAVLAAVG